MKPPQQAGGNLTRDPVPGTQALFIDPQATTIAAKGDIMASINGTSGDDQLDMIGYGDSDDSVYGGAGNDTILGWNGNDTLDGWTGSDKVYGEGGNDTMLGYDGADTLYGGADNDVLYGESDYDILYGDSGNDTLEGGSTYDDLYGGLGVDQLTGGDGADYFYFDTADSGDIFDNLADTITDFSDDDEIFLKGSYTFAGNTDAPADGQYSIWQMNGDYVVTWNATGEGGFHDVIVKGGDPSGDISFY